MVSCSKLSSETLHRASFVHELGTQENTPTISNAEQLGTIASLWHSLTSTIQATALKIVTYVLSFFSSSAESEELQAQLSESPTDLSELANDPDCKPFCNHFPDNEVVLAIMESLSICESIESAFGIAAKAPSLLRLKEKTAPTPTLCYLGFVLQNDRCRRKLQSTLKKGVLTDRYNENLKYFLDIAVWVDENGDSKKTAEGKPMPAASALGIKSFLPGFSKYLNIPEGKLQPFIQEKKWPEMIDFIIEEKERIDDDDDGIYIPAQKPLHQKVQAQVKSILAAYTEVPQEGASPLDRHEEWTNLYRKMHPFPLLRFLFNQENLQKIHAIIREAKKADGNNYYKRPTSFFHIGAFDGKCYFFQTLIEVLYEIGIQHEYPKEEIPAFKEFLRDVCQLEEMPHFIENFQFGTFVPMKKWEALIDEVLDKSFEPFIFVKKMGDIEEEMNGSGD